MIPTPSVIFGCARVSDPAQVCDRVTEVTAALKARLQKSPLPSREIQTWGTANRMGCTVLFEGEAKANVRGRHNGEERQWSGEIPYLYDFP